MRLVKIPLGNDGCEQAPERITKLIPNTIINESGILKVTSKEEIIINNSEDYSHIIESSLGKIDCFTIAIGGTNQITTPCFKAMIKDSSNSGIIIFCAKPPAYLQKMIAENLVKPQNIILIGIRNWSKEDLALIKQQNLKYYSMKELSFEGKEELCDSVMSVANPLQATYITININVLDPVFAPATNNEEPGGMTTRELIYFIQRLKLLKNLKMADIVEVNPQKEVTDTTIKTAVKIITELA